MTLGFGGVTAELLADTVTLICPVVAQEVLAALQSLRLWPLLDGYRGRVPGDVAAVVDTAIKMQAMMRACDVVEVEVNPLMVLSKGAIAVDAVIWEAEE
jgi:hypothetical protein